MAKEQAWIFFDIDGTLLYARGAGRKAFRQAFDEALGWDQGVEHINFYGATDLDVFRRIATDRGEVSTPEMERSFFDRLGATLETHLAETPPELFPNVKHIVSELAKRWDLGIVTGNIEATAKAKLKYAGLLDYFEPQGFGCGCDHPDRVEIARLALERAGNPKGSVLIGDTPKDVLAANENGMVSIAVATGVFDAPTLKSAGADYVFEDLTDADRLFRTLDQVGSMSG
jgi:phosphoglycolate phosphatase